ncbi:zinc ribbon domain-containing protein [Methanobacterium paludis]|uniref:Zinc-ribbon domain-containing protein n=1 Tax=Methanobacterium paludis (strain DSM 25820 / JCM 18151 / SWAN1) TaxID=868131 RepID=F6D3L1_METPW|nr:zinc ribbon domain-containing protein [Methanobacterium paludis]AEG17428.1 hypothetical protein MSWAN_0386 [Methanobacterium paludis]
MRCENCGSEVRKGEKYCPSCGMELIVSDYKPRHKQDYKPNYKLKSKSDYKPDYKQDKSDYRSRSKSDYKQDYKSDYQPKSKSDYKPLKNRYIKGEYPERDYDDYEDIPDRFDNKFERSKNKRYERRNYDEYEPDYEVQGKKKSGWKGPIILFLIMALLFGFLIGFILFSKSIQS